METCGLTAEYNPFHKGHARQLDLIRETFGHDVGVVICLSGPFCQHGVPAMVDKSVRTSIALNHGADLVIELPQAFAVATAERFAEGAISILQATGVIRNIAYGCEYPEDHDAICDAAELLVEEPHELYDHILAGIREGKGFAASRSGAVVKLTGDQRYRSILGSSNSILAVEYEKALRRRCNETDGNEPDNRTAHNSIATHALPLFDKRKLSATAVRNVVSHLVQKIYDDNSSPCGANTFLEVFRYLSTVLTYDSAAAVMKALSEGKGFLTEEMIAPTLLLSPYFRDVNTLREISGMQGGLAERLYGALSDDPLNVLRNQFQTNDVDTSMDENAEDTLLPYDRFVRQMATRAHPASRVRRAILAAAFDIRCGDTALCHDGPQYIRVLGFTRRGRRLLSFMRHTATLPVLMNASDYRSLKTESARRQAELDLYAQAWWNHHASLHDADEFKREPIISK
ncbi:MAG TPA: nucleotidyltransferase family protein [Clostridiaceae bacterium]|nr:nucleotidyltransferase family protein [Clostridiaceae bacterium]